MSSAPTLPDAPPPTRSLVRLARVGLLAAVLLVAPIPLLAQGSSSPAYCYEPIRPVLVEIDGNGISAWNQANPRRGFPVVHGVPCGSNASLAGASGPKPQKIFTENQSVSSWDEAALESTVVVRNNSNQSVVVTIPYQSPGGTVEILDAVWRQYQEARKAWQEAVAAGGSGGTPVADGDTEQLTGLLRLLFEVYREDWALLSPLGDETDARVQRLSELAGRVRSALEATTSATTAGASGPPKPAAGAAGATPSPREKRNAAVLRLLDQFETYRESLSVSKEVAAECPGLPQSRACSFTSTLPPGAPLKLEGEVWRRLVEGSTGILQIKIRFFDQVDLVSRDAAYLRVRSKVKDPGNDTSWSVSANVGYTVAPEVDRDPDDKLPGFFTRESPYSDGRLRRFTGLARIQLEQTYSNIASARVIGQFKSGDLGETSQTRDLTVPDYTVAIAGRQGLSLRFGKTGFYTPASGIAIKEAGEGFEISFPLGLSLAHIVRRESLTGLADDADDDTRTTLGRWRFRPPIASSLLEVVEIGALAGQVHLKDQSAYDHWTVGIDSSGSAQLSEPSLFTLTGRAALYYSERDATKPTEDQLAEPKFVEVSDGSGKVWLVQASITEFASAKNGKVPKVERVWTLTHAGGDGDDPETAKDEGFLGETNAFAPDQLFLAGLAGASREPVIEIPSAMAGADPITRLGAQVLRPGLSNKRYYGVRWQERQHAGRISPLSWINRWINPEEAPTSETLTLALHHYQLSEPVDGEKDAGLEANLTMEVQLPKQVTTQISASYYWPGDATRSFFEENVFGAKALVSIKF